jgi:ABC-type antimicrobial peptide transport system permease subunit
LSRVAQWSATLIPYCSKTWVTYLASTCWKTGLSVPISNLFYGCYELVMQILSRLMMHTEETEAQLALLASVSMDLMTDVIGPLGEALTLLTAGQSNPGMNDGPSF